MLCTRMNLMLSTDTILLAVLIVLELKILHMQAVRQDINLQHNTLMSKHDT